MINKMFYLAVVGSFALGACSGGEDKVEQVLPQDPPSNINEALARVNDALGGGQQAVAAADLKTLLPEKLAGLDRVSYEAERAGFGVKVSKASAQYGDEKELLSLMITDLGAVSGLAKMGMEMFETEIDREDENGFERTQQYKGHRSYQRLISKNGQSLGEIMVFVDGRFTVHLDGQNLDWDELMDALDELDLAALEAMNKTVASGN